MSLKKFITLASAIATCLASPLFANEAPLHEIESSLPPNVAASIRNITQVEASNAVTYIKDEGQAFQDKFTNYAQDYFKNYAIRYLSDNGLHQYDIPHFISREELRDLLVDYINERYSGTPLGENADIQVSNSLNAMLPPNIQSVPLIRLIRFAANHISATFRSYLVNSLAQGSARYVRESRLTADRTGNTINICIPETCYRQGLDTPDSERLKLHLKEGLRFIGCTTIQDYAYHYCRTHSDNTSRYFALRFVTASLSDFIVARMFTNDVQLYCSPLVTQTDDIAYEVSLYEVRFKFTMNPNSFNEVFDRTIEQLVGANVKNTAERNGALAKLKNYVKISMDYYLNAFFNSKYSDITFEIAALHNPNDDISVDSLLNVFNKGTRNETATSAQIDALIQRWSPLI